MIKERCYLDFSKEHLWYFPQGNEFYISRLDCGTRRIKLYASDKQLHYAYYIGVI